MSEYGMIIQVPRWRLVVETGHGWEELTADEKRQAMDYICTDQTEALLKQYRDLGERLCRQVRERVDAAVMESINGN